MIPKSLLDIAGIKNEPAPLSESVLVLVDVQKEYAEGGLQLDGIRESLTAAGRVLARARAAGTPVVHIVQASKPDAPIFAEGSPMAEIADEVAPIEGEAIIPKKLPCSFAGTTLQEHLQALGRKNLVVIGYMTHMCLSTTVRNAVHYGYRCAVVADATTTRDLPDGLGGFVPAAEVKRANLAALADRFAAIVRTADDLPM